jgi:hypothetical protein
METYDSFLGQVLWPEIRPMNKHRYLVLAQGVLKSGKYGVQAQRCDMLQKGPEKPKDCLKLETEVAS